MDEYRLIENFISKNENELNKPLELFTVEEINNLCMDFRNSRVDGRTYFKFVKYLERFFDNKK